MPSPSAPRRLDADTRRAQLLEAAQALFIERGFEGVGMNDVAHALGTSRPTVYAYFTSTEAMLRALLDARLPALWQRLRPLLDTGTGLAALDYAAIFTALLHERDLLLLMHSGGGPTFREERARFLDELAALLAPYRPEHAARHDGALRIVTLLLEAVAVESLRHPGATPGDVDDTLAAFIAGGLAALRRAPA
ncbi:AcrR family transcriptional regulator [Deinococcus metalli]|uniref:AcrR family transcriptional regulator n=1 Tax=Deinococcus metalli TaxID=1141878 RepID=A0A7W8KFC3_9DEIO|nr:TetR/AcrR family transcriptional regulator [Deinococcus metalli]MBB5376875.1 AcrR family transcriptional regulator [Deinococcus metalli]GHF45997.1 TetR family transcriptional regulator [Deinococcus metalli]